MYIGVDNGGLYLLIIFFVVYIEKKSTINNIQILAKIKNKNQNSVKIKNENKNQHLAKIENKNKNKKSTLSQKQKPDRKSTAVLKVLAKKLAQSHGGVKLDLELDESHGSIDQPDLEPDLELVVWNQI